uniref:Putative ovule protein n=2 Tax=Solanum chacoense TaxID=4108 RepID=A0A0V0HLM3_SOLCH
MLSSHKQGVTTNIQVINKEQSLNGTIKLSNKHRVATDIEMGNKEPGVNGTIKLPNKHGVATDIEVGNKERRVNGTIKGQPLTMSKRKTLAQSKPKASSMSPGADHIAQASKRPPHPDSKYLNQILSVPKMDEWSGFYDQEWLLGSKSTLVRKPDVCLDEVKDHQVWSEALQIDSADVFALPYVIPY